MNELIAINYEGEAPTVSGRELHEALEVKSKYADWFKNMCAYGFTEGKDYTAFSKILENGGRSIEHALTISTAKEICMLQRNEKGKQFRQYFIKVEEEWNSPEMVMKRALEIGEGNLAKAEKSKRALAIKEMNAKVRLSNQFLKLAKIETLSTECKNILLAKAAEVLSGTELTPQPNFDQKTYSAAEVGKMFGVTAQKIGRISNEHKMKTPEYGAWYRSKSEYSDREVDTFRYNDKAVERFKDILLFRDIMG